MPLKLGLALLLVVAMVGCGGLDLSDIAVTWDITVTNAGPGDAIVGISGKDVNRRAVVPAGTSVTAISFAVGSVLISVGPAAGVLAQMKARRDQIAAKLAAKPIDFDKQEEIWNLLVQGTAEIDAYADEQVHSQCTIRFKRDIRSGSGVDAFASASFDGSRFNLAC